MSRHPDWPRRLALWVQARRRTVFAWGSHDCALCAADWVLEATGTDLGLGWRGTYDSAEGAAAALAAAGYADVTGPAGAALPEVAVQFAGRGDVVAADMGGALALGVVVDHRAAFAALRGLAFRPVIVSRRAWRV